MQNYQFLLIQAHGQMLCGAHSMWGNPTDDAKKSLSRHADLGSHDWLNNFNATLKLWPFWNFYLQTGPSTPFVCFFHILCTDLLGLSLHLRNNRYLFETVQLFIQHGCTLFWWGLMSTYFWLYLRHFWWNMTFKCLVQEILGKYICKYAILAYKGVEMS